MGVMQYFVQMCMCMCIKFGRVCMKSKENTVVSHSLNNM